MHAGLAQEQALARDVDVPDIHWQGMSMSLTFMAVVHTMPPVLHTTFPIATGHALPSVIRNRGKQDGTGWDGVGGGSERGQDGMILY